MDMTELIRDVRSKRIPVAADSRQVMPGGIFVVVPGVSSDGAQYVGDALNAGAQYIVCQPGSDAVGIAYQRSAQVILHDDAREAVWRLAQAYYKTDTLPMRIIGITGTNGKTTTAYVLEHLFTRMGHKVGVLGTVSYRWPGYVENAPLTTPDSLRIHEMLAQMAEAGVDVVVMEVSSHALEQQRVGGVHFSAAVFSNLTQDHLDFHKDMESYFAAKSMLFTHYPDEDKVCAINADDVWGQKLQKICANTVSFGLHTHVATSERHLQGAIRSMSPRGLELHMEYDGQSWDLHSPLVGAFNAANLLAVQAVALGLGVSVADLRYLEDFCGVPGRLERVVNPQGLNVFVDYAHTPDALINVLQALRGAGFSRIITVFGCGGNRDRTKRPRMGAAVASLSDVAVLTSDNPRFEDPQTIIEDVLPGLRSTKAPVEIIIEPNRYEATKKALQMMAPGDALCIAGKGHEDYQIIQGVRHPYSDQETVKEILQCA